MKDNKRTWSDSSYQMLIALWRTVSTPFRWIKGYLTRALYTSKKQTSNSQLPTWLPYASILGVPPYMTSSQKHTVELKGQNHQSSSDILGVLEETHTLGRYRLRANPRIVTLKYSHLRTLDIYFTDPAGTNVLGIGSDAVNVPTAAQIASRTDLWLFVNFLDTTKITTPTAGTLTEVIAVNDSEFDFDTTNGTAVVYEDFGSNSGKLHQRPV